MIPKFYQTPRQKYLTPSQFLVMTILLSLMQSEKQVRLERLSRVFPCLITAESRRRKLQRFLDLPNLTIELIWFPLITYWLTTYCSVGQTLSIAIDRSQWGCINLFMVSLIWERRAIPLYWSLLPKFGSSKFEEQTTNIQQVLPLFSKYKVIVLGDREFCSIDLGNWLKEKGVSFCLRLKRNHCIEIEHLVWQRTSLYFQGKRVRKTRPATGFDVACKWKRNYGAWKVEEAWFILTDLGSLPTAIDAYKQRMGIEEMFRDCKTGGYDIEGTSLKGNRLINMILLMTLAYLEAIFQGTQLRKKQVQKYVCRRKEPKKRYRRRSTFGVGLDGEKWVNYLEKFSLEVEQLMKLTPNKRPFINKVCGLQPLLGLSPRPLCHPPQKKKYSFQ
jgi:hypothetical protein